MALTKISSERAGLAMADLVPEVLLVTLPASYTTGGDTGLAAGAGIKANNILAVLPIDPGPYHLSYNSTTDKLRVFQVGAAGALVEVGAGTNLGATQVKVLVLGQAQ